MRKYFSLELLTALIIDVCILFFTFVIAADLNDARETQIAFGVAFLLMIVIAVIGYKRHQKKLSV
jgi:hypothetical protein